MVGEGQEDFPQSPMSAEKDDQNQSNSLQQNAPTRQSLLTKIASLFKRGMAETAKDIGSGRVHQTLNPTTHPEAYPPPQEQSPRSPVNEPSKS